jgi:hypothetical protein
LSESLQGASAKSRRRLVQAERRIACAYSFVSPGTVAPALSEVSASNSLSLSQHMLTDQESRRSLVACPLTPSCGKPPTTAHSSSLEHPAYPVSKTQAHPIASTIRRNYPSGWTMDHSYRMEHRQSGSSSTDYAITGRRANVLLARSWLPSVLPNRHCWPCCQTALYLPQTLYPVCEHGF